MAVAIPIAAVLFFASLRLVRHYEVLDPVQTAYVFFAGATVLLIVFAAVAVSRDQPVAAGAFVLAAAVSVSALVRALRRRPK
jgi:hypothetical protein